MTGRYITRREWGARPPASSGPGALDEDQVEGIALHWPGLERGTIHGVDAVSAALRSWQRSHIDDKGWSDIAYQEAFDQEGNVYALRGLQTQSGANGDQDVNERFGALLLVLGPGEAPSGPMIAAVRHRIEVFDSHFAGSRRIVGHRDIRPEPTACPGDLVTGLIRRDVFRAPQPNRVELARRRIRAGLQLLDTIPDGSRPAVEHARDAIRDQLRKMPDK